MKTLKKYIQLMGLVLLIAVLYHIRLEWLLPYLLPLTMIGVVGILVATFLCCKRQGWLSVLAVVLGMGVLTSPKSYAYELVNCGGQHNGKTVMERFMSGEVVSGALQGLQEEAGGNVFTNEFDSEKVLACVMVNMINAGEEIESAPKDGETCDPRLRRNAFYFKDNYLRMDANKASDNMDRGWIEEQIKLYNNAEISAALQAAQRIDKDANDLIDSVEEYIEYCAEIDLREERTCRTVSQTILKNSKECWICQIVESLLFSVQRVSVISYVLLLKFSLSLLGVIFLFWIAIKVLHMISTLGYGDYGGFFTEFLMRVITVSIAAAILYAPIVDFYGTVISPFIQVTTAFAGRLSEMSFETPGQSLYDQVREDAAFGVNTLQWDNPRENCLVYCKNMTNDKFKYSEEQLSLMGGVSIIDEKGYNGLLCLSCRASNQVTPFIAIGERFTCYAFANSSNLMGTGIYIPDIMYLLTGWMFIIAFTLISVIISFYVIDIILRLGFVIILTPLLVVAWAFPISREYTVRGWNLILYSLFQFIGIAVMMTLFMVLFMNLFTDLPGVGGTVQQQLIQAMKEDNVELLYDILTEYGTFAVALKLILAVLVGLKMLSGVNACVETLSSISPGIPGVAMESLKKMVQGTFSTALAMAGVASEAASKTTKKVFKDTADIARRRQTQKGRFDKKDTGPTNTHQKMAEQLNRFSEASRNASGGTINNWGKDIQKRGEDRVADGKEMVKNAKERMEQGGIRNRVGGAMDFASGYMQQGLGHLRALHGSVLNKIAVATGIGNGMNWMGRKVADVTDKVAAKVQQKGDERQRNKEARLRADPNAAARRERGYSRIARGGDRAAKGGVFNMAMGSTLMMVGALGVVAAKSQIVAGSAKRLIDRTIRSR